MTAADALVPSPVPPAADVAAARLQLVPPPQPRSASVWCARIDRGGDVDSLVVVASDRLPAGAAVDLRGSEARGRRPAGWLVDVRYRTSDGGLVGIEVPGGPDGLGFTEVHHVGAVVPSVSLHAGIAGGHVGEVRWWLRSGLVESVRVEPGWRGRGIGRALVAAGEGLRLVRGWAPLHADGRLTDTAAAWLATAPPWWAPRLAARTHALPAEPEPGSPAGVTRLLADLPTRVV